MAFTASTWGQGRLLTGLSPGSSLTGFGAVITKDNLPASALDTGLLSLINGGGDFRLSTDINGATQLPVEIVTCVTNATASSTEFEAWVRFPTYASGTREVYAFWNKAGQSQPLPAAAFGRNDVWQDFKYRFHFNSSNQLVDSAGNYGLTKTGTVTSNTGPIGDDADTSFNTSNFLEVTGYTGESGASARTHSGWFNSESLSSNIGLLDYGTNSTGERFQLIKLSNGKLRIANAGTNKFTDTTYNDSVYHSFNVIFDGTSSFPGCATLVVDGAEPSSTSGGSNTLNIVPDGNIRFDVFDPIANNRFAEYGLRLFSISADMYESEDDNQSDPSTFWTLGTVFVPGGATLTITESVATLNMTSVDPVIDFTGLISIVEGSEPLNITSIDPTVTLTATLTITESTSTLNIANNDPDITLTAPDTLVITESTATLNITTQSPNITLSGTLSIVESTKTIDMLTRDPSVTLGLPVYTQTFTGIQKAAEFTGTTKLYGFTGTITELQTFSGTAKAASFLGVTE
jgi:hypothetical protein